MSLDSSRLWDFAHQVSAFLASLSVVAALQSHFRLIHIIQKKDRITDSQHLQARSAIHQPFITLAVKGNSSTFLISMILNPFYYELQLRMSLE